MIGKIINNLRKTVKFVINSKSIRHSNVTWRSRAASVSIATGQTWIIRAYGARTI